MKRLLLFSVLLISSFSNATVTANTFDPATNILTLDSVIYQDKQYFNVKIRVDQFTVKLVGSSESVNPEPPVILPPPVTPPPVNSGACGLDRFTAANFDAIQIGMSFDQVVQLMGCSPSRANRLSGMVTHVWINLEVTQMFIAVTFDESTMRATGNLGPVFKFWQGRSFVGQ